VDVVVEVSGVGAEAASQATRHLVANFAVKAIILIGGAGALRDDCKVGDIVVVTNTCNGYEDRTGSEMAGDQTTHCMTADPVLCRIARDVARQVTTFAEGRAVFFGCAVSVDRFVSTPLLRGVLRQRFMADCVDVETAALAEACAQRSIPWLALRGITDHANVAFEELQPGTLQKVNAPVVVMLREIVRRMGAQWSRLRVHAG
jgi:adenosylhomocysteine nucleosidase